MRQIFTVVATALATCILASSLPAAPITFSAPVAITTADATLDLPGYRVVGAATFGGGPTTVTTATQTIVFTANGGGVANITQGGNVSNTAGFSGSGNANFDSALNNFADDGGPTIVQLQNLTVGQKYQVQLFGLDDRDCCGSRTIEFSDGLGDNSTSFAQSSNMYVLGTFTANATTENIESVGVGQGQSNFNALVLEVSTPEPSTIAALAGLGGMGLIGLVVRRRRAV
jgi:hypothetical protein